MLPHRCVHCLAANGAEVKFDKRGRPYTTCRFCLTRSFFHSLDALRGIAVVPPLLELELQRRDTDETYRETFDGRIRRVMAAVRDLGRASAPASSDMSSAPQIVPFEEKKIA